MYKFEIKRPSSFEIEAYIEKWNSLENYVLQESSLKKLFLETYKYNTEMEDVLIKVCALNDFYSTNIFSPFVVAKHIVNLKIDNRLEKDDLNVVNEIAKIEMNGGNVKNFYSFATKYCSHHKPTVYPIYDSYVEKLLWYFKKKDKFSEFSREDLRSFPLFKNILLDFRKFYGLESFDLKNIDQYLWQVGKEYFPKNYTKRLKKE